MWDNSNAYELANFAADFCGGSALGNFGDSDGSECFSLLPGAAEAMLFAVGT